MPWPAGLSVVEEAREEEDRSMQGSGSGPSSYLASPVRPGTSFTSPAASAPGYPDPTSSSQSPDQARPDQATFAPGTAGSAAGMMEHEVLASEAGADTGMGTDAGGGAGGWVAFNDAEPLVTGSPSTGFGPLDAFGAAPFSAAAPSMPPAQPISAPTATLAAAPEADEPPQPTPVLEGVDQPPVSQPGLLWGGEGSGFEPFSGSAWAGEDSLFPPAVQAEAGWGEEDSAPPAPVAADAETSAPQPTPLAAPFVPWEAPAPVAAEAAAAAAAPVVAEAAAAAAPASAAEGEADVEGLEHSGPLAVNVFEPTSAGIGASMLEAASTLGATPAAFGGAAQLQQAEEDEPSDADTGEEGMPEHAAIPTAAAAAHDLAGPSALGFASLAAAGGAHAEVASSGTLEPVTAAAAAAVTAPEEAPPPVTAAAAVRTQWASFGEEEDDEEGEVWGAAGSLQNPSPAAGQSVAVAAAEPALAAAAGGSAGVTLPAVATGFGFSGGFDDATGFGDSPAFKISTEQPAAFLPQPSAGEAGESTHEAGEAIVRTVAEPTLALEPPAATASPLFEAPAATAATAPDAVGWASFDDVGGPPAFGLPAPAVPPPAPAAAPAPSLLPAFAAGGFDFGGADFGDSSPFDEVPVFGSGGAQPAATSSLGGAAVGGPAGSSTSWPPPPAFEEGVFEVGPEAAAVQVDAAAAPAPATAAVDGQEVEQSDGALPAGVQRSTAGQNVEGERSSAGRRGLEPRGSLQSHQSRSAPDLAVGGASHTFEPVSHTFEAGLLPPTYEEALSLESLPITPTESVGLPTVTSVTAAAVELADVVAAAPAPAAAAAAGATPQPVAVPAAGPAASPTATPAPATAGAPTVTSPAPAAGPAGQTSAGGAGGSLPIRALRRPPPRPGAASSPTHPPAPESVPPAPPAAAGVAAVVDAAAAPVPAPGAGSAAAPASGIVQADPAATGGAAEISAASAAAAVAAAGAVFKAAAAAAVPAPAPEATPAAAAVPEQPPSVATVPSGFWALDAESALVADESAPAPAVSASQLAASAPVSAVPMAIAAAPPSYDAASQAAAPPPPAYEEAWDAPAVPTTHATLFEPQAHLLPPPSYEEATAATGLPSYEEAVSASDVPQPPSYEDLFGAASGVPSEPATAAAAVPFTAAATASSLPPPPTYEEVMLEEFVGAKLPGTSPPQPQQLSPPSPQQPAAGQAAAQQAVQAHSIAEPPPPSYDEVMLDDFVGAKSQGLQGQAMSGDPPPSYEAATATTTNPTTSSSVPSPDPAAGFRAAASLVRSGTSPMQPQGLGRASQQGVVGREEVGGEGPWEDQGASGVPQYLDTRHSVQNQLCAEVGELLLSS